MDTAEMLFKRNVDNPEEFLKKPSGYPHTSEVHVSIVCAGYAFEILFKVMVRMSGDEPKATHNPSAAYKKLAQIDRDSVDEIVAKHGWSDSNEFLSFLNNHLCNVNLKYWMRPREGGELKGNFYLSGKRSISNLKLLHDDLTDHTVTRVKTCPTGADEIWMGFHLI